MRTKRTPSPLRRRGGLRPGAGFTLIEILVAVVLLSGSLAAMMTLWSVSRRITERSRDTAEYYAIARQEQERYRPLRFNGLFNNAGFTFFNIATPTTNAPRSTDYDQNGNEVVTGASNAYYRAKSTFSLRQTSGEAAVEQLGVQVVVIHTLNGTTEGPAVYRTVMFFAIAGV